MLSIATGAQSCWSKTILPAELIGLSVKRLLDTGTSKRFVGEGVVITAKLTFEGKPTRVSMASDKLIASVLGKVCRNFSAR